MKQDAVLIASTQYFSIFEHGVEGRKIIGNARLRPSDAAYDLLDTVKKIDAGVAAWRIKSLRGRLGVVNPGGKSAASMRLCADGEIADETTVGREARLNELTRRFAGRIFHP